MRKRSTIEDKYAIKIVSKLLEKPISSGEFDKYLDYNTRKAHNLLQDIKRAGFEVVRKNHYLEIKKIETKLDIEEKEASILAYFLMLSSFLLPQYKTEVLCRVLEKILIISNRTELINIFNKFDYFKMANFNADYQEKLKAIQDYIANKQQLRVILKTKEEMKLKPIEFEWEDETIMIKFMDERKKDIIKIAIQDIVKIIPKGKRKYTPATKETFFELKGKLALSYLLKDEERMVDSLEDSIIVANSSGNKTELFKRLLKYGEFCEIILPKTQKEEFEDIICASLKNLKANNA